MSASATAQSTIDFAICEAERIDAPGAIQGFGALIALNRQTGRVTHVSRNADLGLAKAEDIIGVETQALAAALGLTVDLASACAAMRAAAEGADGRVQPTEVAHGEGAAYLLSLGLGHFILERRPEPQEGSPEPPAAWLARLSQGVAGGDRPLAANAQPAMTKVVLAARDLCGWRDGSN